VKDVDPEDDRGIASLLVDQVEFANVILLNKTDLVSAAQLAALKAVVAALNPEAAIIETRNSRVALDRVLNTHLFDLDKVLPPFHCPSAAICDLRVLVDGCAGSGDSTVTTW
jgi:G3E family GTPase